MASRPFSEFFFIRIILVPNPTRVGFLKMARGIFLRLSSDATIEVKYNGGDSAARGIYDGPT